MDRRETNRALAKAIAYVECGKPETAAKWLGDLVSMFADEGVHVCPPSSRYANTLR